MSAAVIATQDWRRQFGGGLAWLALAIVLVAVAWDWLGRVDRFVHLQQTEQSPGSVTQFLVMPALAQLAPLLLLLVAVMSLRGLSEDRRLGTLALLRGSPQTPSAVILGKWFGQLALPLVLLLLIGTMVASLALGTQLDWGWIGAALLGLLLLVLAASALALAIAAWVSQPLLVVALSLVVVFGLWFIDLAPLRREVGDSPLRLVSLAASFRPFLAGTVSASSVAWLGGLIALGLVLARLGLAQVKIRYRLLGALIASVAALLLAVAVTGLDWRADWTESQRNSLSPVSRQVLTQLQGPVSLTVFAEPDQRLRRSIGNFLERFAQYKQDWSTEYIDPSVDPERMRELNVRGSGEVRMSHNGRELTLRNLSEQSVVNALFQMARISDTLIGYSYGSGERDLHGVADFDLGSFGLALQQRGVQATPVDLVLNPQVPDNLKALVVTQPRAELLPGVAQSIRMHLQRGGNVLWLADPGPLYGLEALLDELRLEALPGTLIDATAPGRGEDPLSPVVSRYGEHSLVRDFALRTLFPRARAWTVNASAWQSQTLVQTTRNSWNERGDLLGDVGLDPNDGEQRGPLALALALSRQVDGDEQRVIVVGDGDFLSNRYLGNGGNLDLGLRMIDWLLAEDRFIDIPARLQSDRRLELTREQSGGLGLVWLVLVPGLCLLLGWWRWWMAYRA